MKITRNELVRFSAPTRLLIEWDNKQLEGATIMELLGNSEVTLELVMFVHKYFAFTEEEENEYKKAIRVDNNCGLVINSALVEGSEAIFSSVSVKDSQFVGNSNGVTSSVRVFDSRGVEGSEEVFRSADIKTSNNVFNSIGVENSYGVVGSNDISWSKRIVDTSRAQDSMLVGNSEDVTNCYCSLNLKGCRSCIFCFGLKDKEYHIFNQEVDAREFERCQEILSTYLEDLELADTKMIECYYKDATWNYNANGAIKKLFQDLPPQFVEEVKKFPKFAPTLLSLISFNTLNI